MISYPQRVVEMIYLRPEEQIWPNLTELGQLENAVKFIALVPGVGPLKQVDLFQFITEISGVKLTLVLFIDGLDRVLGGKNVKMLECVGGSSDCCIFGH